MIRVLVTGSRTWAGPDLIEDELDLIAAQARTAKQPITVVHGGAVGADRMAGTWARRAAANGWPVTEEVHAVPPADWRTKGKRAGMDRNQHMVDLGADICLAFIDPCWSVGCTRPQPHDSHGAAGCAAMAKTAGIRTVTTRSPNGQREVWP